MYILLGALLIGALLVVSGIGYLVVQHQRNQCGPYPVVVYTQQQGQTVTLTGNDYADVDGGATCQDAAKIISTLQTQQYFVPTQSGFFLGDQGWDCDPTKDAPFQDGNINMVCTSGADKSVSYHP